MKDWDNKTNEELVFEYQKTNSEELFNYFLERNMGLLMSFVGKHISKYPQYGEEFIQYGRIAMWETMKAFKSGLAKFSTLYHYYIKKQITYHRRYLHTVRIPAYVLEDLEKYLKDPGDRILNTYSLDEPVKTTEDQDGTLHDVVASDELTPEELVFQDLDHKALEPLLTHLKPRELYVIRLWLGLDRGHKRTLEECGTIVGVTRERIRQIVAKGIKRLRIYAHLYFDVPKYDPTKDKYYEKPKTEIRNYTDRTTRGTTRKRVINKNNDKRFRPRNKEKHNVKKEN